MRSFHDWLVTRAQEPAQAGAAGIALDRLCRLLVISPEVFEDLLRALVTAGQVTVVSVGGRRVYRAAM
jgi:hypothetical protein